MKSLIELRAYLAEFATRCRSMRWLGAFFHVSVLQDIERDAEAEIVAAGQTAHTCEVHDLEAAKLIEAGDCASLRKALVLVRRNADREHTLSEQLTA